MDIDSELYVATHLTSFIFCTHYKCNYYIVELSEVTDGVHHDYTKKYSP